MSKKTARPIVWLLSVLVVVFTVWNMIDFVNSSYRSTASYIAVILNILVIIATARLIYLEVK